MITLEHARAALPSTRARGRKGFAVAGVTAAAALGGAIAVVAIGGEREVAADRAARGPAATAGLRFGDPVVIKGARGGAFQDPRVVKGARGAPLD
jgi:hypothetical protein